ncbi:MAG TPA: alpha/beta hydrolase [Actinobacteria bacterium]|nr:alpha/beta hydrolase [Actinomycetota bacterium]
MALPSDPPRTPPTTGSLEDAAQYSGGKTTRIEIRGEGLPVLLAPGAGAGSDHPFMTGMRDRLVAAGFRVATFDYPYHAEGRRAPDRFERLVECHHAVYERVGALAGNAPFLVGKSMGGRIGSHLAVPAPGRVFLGYPLVAMGKQTPRDVSHLAGLGPMLFVQGERDAMAPLALIQTVVAGLEAATLEVVPDADHGFRVPRRTGIDAAAMLDHIGSIVASWMRSRRR